MEKNQKTTLINIHGFLGSSKDFKPLIPSDDYEILSFDLRPQVQDFCDWQSLCQKIYKQIPKETQVLIGYSMGGRVMRFLLENFTWSKNTKFIFLASHLGFFSNPEDIKTKLEFNKRALQKAKEAENVHEFLDFWNSLPLFTEDLPLRTTTWSLEDICHALEYWTKPEPIGESSKLKDVDNLFYVYGSCDAKYKNQAQVLQNLNDKARVLELKDRGHRLLQNADFDLINKIL